jgi:hypothetical protein
MICAICKKEMNISEGLTEMSGKKCHISCKEQHYEEWRKKQGLNRNS